jgi:hypothetical protein
VRALVDDGVESCGLMGKSVTERFEERYIPEPNSGCWLWLGWLDPKGYGRFWDNGRSDRAHRFSYRRDRGAEIPDGIYVCHRCDNPTCVNPEHLFLGTPQENQQDSIAKGRHVTVKEGVDYARGVRQRNAKLADADVIEIRKRTLTRREAAAKYGVSVNTIRMIHLGRAWKHVRAVSA